MWTEWLYAMGCGGAGPGDGGPQAAMVETTSTSEKRNDSRPSRAGPESADGRLGSDL